MDSRMLGAIGSGVATYARALRAAQRSIDPASIVLADAGGATARADRARRWLRALLPRGIDAVVGDGEASARDIFRLSQVWFDVHRRLLPVRVPGPPGIMHWSYPVPLRLVGWSNVYTVHDAIPLTRPDLTPIAPRRHRRLLDAIACEASRDGAIATVSAAARAEIVAAIGCPPALVTDCSQAVLRHDDRSVALPRGLVEDGFLLVCGTVELRKNVPAIITAYRRNGVAIPLVIAGPDPRDDRALGAALFAGPDIVRLRDVDEAVMTALLARARALLMPSLAEGFGLPVAEAMAMGTPVLTSATGALAETAGGAALLVDPDDVDGMAAAIGRLAGDAALRRDLAARGRANAERFTLPRFGEGLARLYSGLIASRC